MYQTISDRSQYVAHSRLDSNQLYSSQSYFPLRETFPLLETLLGKNRSYEEEDDDLLDESTDGRFEDDIREIVYGKEAEYAESSFSLDNEEGPEYLDPKMLLPDLYSASLFEDDEEDFVSPLALLYRPNLQDTYEDYFLPKSLAEEDIVEQPEDLEETSPEQGQDLESRLN